MLKNYIKGENSEEVLDKNNLPFENLPDNFLWMNVKGGTKIHNVVDFAKKAFETHRTVVWSGSGGGIQKTISCAEIMKRQFEVHQITRICYSKIEEYWEPQMQGLEQIVATREIPCIHILLSLDPIDNSTAGYQHSKENKSSFWNTGDANRNEGSSSRKRNAPQDRKTKSTVKDKKQNEK